MKFLIVMEFDVPMEPEKLKRFYEYDSKKESFLNPPFWQNKFDENEIKGGIWGDGTGPALMLMEMETETYAKYMSDAEIWEEWHRFCRVAENPRIRTLVPGMDVPPE